MTTESLHRAVLHLPILTTLCAAYFCWELASRYRAKGGGRHLLWWGIGMATYGIGTLTEAWTTLFGWNPGVFRSWYIAGAFLGGYPLAQGSIYLLLDRRFADRSAWIVSSLIAMAAALVVLTPLDASVAQAHRLSGDVIEWRWLRLVSPFINLYSVVFLVGGAVVSARRYRRVAPMRHRFVGNVLIAVGALLPGIGGSLTRAGYVEALYVTELVGIVLIYLGYRKNIAGKPLPAAHHSRAVEPGRPSEERTMSKNAILLLIVAAALAGAAASIAETARAEEQAPAADTDAAEGAADSDEDLNASFFDVTTVTATGSEASGFEVSTPVTVIDAEQIERTLPDNAADLLRGYPGVDVDGVGPNQTRPIIRGQRGLRILFLENGLRMSNPRRQTDFGEIPGLVDIENVERVEVVRGPASVLYGTDAIGGVLNLITKVPPAIAGSQVGASLGLRYGTAGDGVGADGALQGGAGRTSYRVGLSYRDVDDYEAPGGSFGDIRLAGETPVVDTGLSDDTVHGYLAYQASESNSLFLRLNRYRADQSGFGFVEPALFGESEDFRIRILYPFQDFDRYTLGWAGSALESAPADSAQVQLYYQDNERELVNDIDINIGPIFPGAPDSSVTADTLNFTDLETIGLRGELIKLAGERNLVTYGVEAFEDDSFNTDTSTTVTTLRFPFPPFEQAFTAVDTVPNAPNATNTSWGVFAQDEITVLDRLRLTLGARYQDVETEAEATPGWDISGLGFSDDALVWSANATYGVSDNLNVVGSYGTAFRAPNIIERLFVGPTPEGAGFQILNPELASEESENFDVGLKYLRRNAVFEITYFENDISDGIIQYFLSDEEIAALPEELREQIEELGEGIFVVQQRNAERLRYDGFEAVIGWRSARGFSVGGNYTSIDGRRLDSTNPPTGDIVGDKANAYVRYERPQGRRFWGEYRVRHNSEQDANLDPNEPVPPVGEDLPAFTVHTLAGGMTLFERGSQEHTLTVVVDNLTDELYAEFSNVSFFRPQPQRSVSAAYRVRF